MLGDPGSALQEVRPTNKKLLLGVSLRLPSVSQRQVTFIYHVSLPPKFLKHVFHIWIFYIHAGYSETVSLASNYRLQ